MCDLKFKDEVWLEIHVETHFNPSNNILDDQKAVNASGANIYGRNETFGGFSMDTNRASSSSAVSAGDLTKDSSLLGAVAATTSIINAGASLPSVKPRSRANSTSSLTANVDENFELDQMIILSECNTMMDLDDAQYQNGKFVETKILDSK